MVEERRRYLVAIEEAREQAKLETQLEALRLRLQEVRRRRVGGGG